MVYWPLLKVWLQSRTPGWLNVPRPLEGTSLQMARLNAAPKSGLSSNQEPQRWISVIKPGSVQGKSSANFHPEMPRWHRSKGKKLASISLPLVRLGYCTYLTPWPSLQQGGLELQLGLGRTVI